MGTMGRASSLATAPPEAVSPEAVPERVPPAVRLLPQDEWHRLYSVPPFSEGIQVSLSQHDSVIVAEDERGQIVGYWLMFYAMHVEPMWIAPAYRGRVGIIRRLWGAVQDRLRDLGLDLAFALINPGNPAVDYAKRLGFVRTQGDCYWVSAKKPSPEIEQFLAEYAARSRREGGGA